MQSFLASAHVPSVIAASTRGSGFQSLLASPLFAPANVRVPASEPVRHEGQPSVEFVQENGKISRIIVTCSCCERIELDCEYPA